jgi:hypothetical protein
LIDEKKGNRFFCAVSSRVIQKDRVPSSTRRCRA